MLRRMLFALLIACLAIPATASPLVGSAVSGDTVAASPCHGGAPMDEQHPAQVTKHQCIGCVPPVAAFTLLDAPTELRGIVGMTVLIHRLDGLSDHPATPPPRT